VSVFATYYATDHSEGITLDNETTPDDGLHYVPKYVGDLLTSVVYAF
jgi:hypothetical protein